MTLEVSKKSNISALWSKINKSSSILSKSPDLLYRTGRRFIGYDNINSLYYVVPATNWVTDWVGRYITTAVSQQFDLHAQVTSSPHLLIDHILHYGEAGAFLASIGTRRNRENALIATIFHGNYTAEFPQLTHNTKQFVENTPHLTKVITACRLMENRLIKWGVPSEKIACIPLGIDLEKFHPATTQQRIICRQQSGVPDDAFCIGSFQKDGDGWSEGLSPKLVKGPDIFLRVVKNLHKQYTNLFVLLTAPARGYVKQGLTRMGVPFSHTVLSDFQAVAKMYHCLDAYLITSREEGGPKAVLESLASGTPLVSTRVGMSPDVIKHGINGLLTEIEDVAELTEAVSQLIEDKVLRQRLAAKGLEDIQAYGWQNIAARYYQEVYKPILAAS